MSSHVTRNSTGWSNAAQDLIALVDPDTSWPEQFELEAAALRSLVEMTEGVQIEYFGSTAVPNLRAKPVIDIMLIHPEPQEWPRLVIPLQRLGYVYWAENPRKDRMFFVKGMPPFDQQRTHHIHVRVPSDAQRELLFRDLLRTDPMLTQEYARLKEHLALHHPTDRDAYTDGKTEFVSAALGRSAV